MPPPGWLERRVGRLEHESLRATESQLVEQRFERIGERVAHEGHRSQGPDRAAEFLRRALHHPAGDFEVFGLATLRLAHGQEGAERLQERVVQVGGEPVALPPAGVVLDGGVTPELHFAGEQPSDCAG